MRSCGVFARCRTLRLAPLLHDPALQERGPETPAPRGRRSASAASPSFERRLALLHEGGATLGIILAGEALLDKALAQCEVALAPILHRLAHDGLHGADSQRRIGDDHLTVV